MLAYGDPQDRGDEYFHHGQSPIMACTKHLMQFSFDEYDPIFLRMTCPQMQR